jgi:hypothetical protein
VKKRGQNFISCFRFVPPTNVGGIPIDSYAVEYKEAKILLCFRFVPPTNVGGIPIDSYAVEYKEVIILSCFRFVPPTNIGGIPIDSYAVEYKEAIILSCYRFVPPTNIGGIPIDSYAVEYKEARFDWSSARRRVWPVGEPHSAFIQCCQVRNHRQVRNPKEPQNFSYWRRGATSKCIRI